MSPSLADHCQLDAGVEASGPHVFAVRNACSRRKRRLASTASRPTTVTIMSRPSGRTGRRRYRTDLGVRKTRIFLQTGLDTAVTRRVTDLPVRQRIAGWVERFAKSIAIVRNRMSVASFALRASAHTSLRPFCVLSPVDLWGVRVRRRRLVMAERHHFRPRQSAKMTPTDIRASRRIPATSSHRSAVSA